MTMFIYSSNIKQFF